MYFFEAGIGFQFEYVCREPELGIEHYEILSNHAPKLAIAGCGYRQQVFHTFKCM